MFPFNVGVIEWAQLVSTKKNVSPATFLDMAPVTPSYIFLTPG